jgi:hypothetical protein
MCKARGGGTEKGQVVTCAANPGHENSTQLNACVTQNFMQKEVSFSSHQFLPPPLLFFWQYRSLNSGPCACWESTLPLEPHPHPFCF